MDAKALLQDLHFQLSVSGSSLSITSELKQQSHFDETIQFLEEDRIKMTERWVAKVCQKNRSRSLSLNSYFEEDSVCNKLKKGFLKSFVVNEEDLENLRLRLAELKIADPNVTSEENPGSLRLPLTEQKTEGSNVQDCQGCLKGSEAQSNNIPDFCRFVSFSSLNKRPGHFRSRTVPLPQEVTPQDYHDIATLLMQSQAPQCDPTQNMVSIESVTTKESTVVDENFNFIGKTETSTEQTKCQVISSKSATSNEGEKTTCFRQENLYPTPQELLGRKQSTETLNFNKIVDSYDSEEDYLQTQFYLLREDFLRPLKAGIAHYRKQFREGFIPEEVRDLKLYHNARIVEPRFMDGKIGIAIDVGFPLPEKIGEKDFMDGSLVLITSNHFRNVQVGTVLSRKFNFMGINDHVSMDHKRRSNILMVQLHGSSHFEPMMKHRKILLAESQAFFQPYYYVMKIFQSMTSDDLPLKEYILGSRNKVVQRPSYLVENTHYMLEDDHQVEIEKSSSWPEAELLHVNESQLRAFKKALTEKLVLIQGPPGTGKTYLGCKVAKALLQNRQVWSKEGNQPLLLMCQTNHALDQFMELLVPVTKNIIRIGSQSKSVILAPYTLRECLRKGRKKAKKISHNDNQKIEVKRLATNLKSCYSESLKLKSHGIVNMSTLLNMGIIDLKHACCFESSENYLMWLEEAKECKTIHDSDTGQICEVVSNKYKNNCHTHTSMSGYQHLQVTSGDQEEKNYSSGTVPIESFCIKYALSLPDLKATLEGPLSNNEATESNTEEWKHKKVEIEERLKFYQQHLVVKNRDVSDCTYVIDECLWTVPPCMRWHLYRSWIQKLGRMMQSYLEMLETEFLSASSNMDKIMQSERLEAMRQVELIGMTTSAAARLYPLLCELRCPIALVEEAAEVHESHIVATVTKHCQHLILLGDHKQLRPRPACYSLSQTHFTDVSLFERLVLNNTVTVNTLLTQHRMQPQISALIRPSIYQELHDHKCTRNRKNIIGMKKNVFFFTHSWQEKKNLLTGSYCNPQEARMTVQLLRYLMLRGYGASEVCILTAYREQVREIEKEARDYHELDNVQILTIDNFQGEESRIVIMSLVRNNSENQIGFLKIENRVCVALSRARDGLFMLGNINLLSSNSELWQSVHQVLQANASVGWYLPLKCPRHPRRHRTASQPDHLLLYIQQGGCQQICLFKLPCGHFCKRHCHEDDALHLKYRCEELCKKTCNLGHPCQKNCSEECGDCDSIVWKWLACGHEALVKCSLDLEKYLCEAPVRKFMDPCSHSINLQCWMPALSRKYCPHQCPFMLKCGHQCPLRCNAPRHPNHSEMRCLCEDQRLEYIPYI